MQMAKQVALLEKNGVWFSVITDNRWIKFEDTSFRNKDAGKLESELERCPYVVCKALYENKFLYVNVPQECIHLVPTTE